MVDGSTTTKKKKYQKKKETEQLSKSDTDDSLQENHSRQRDLSAGRMWVCRLAKWGAEDCARDDDMTVMIRMRWQAWQLAHGNVISDDNVHGFADGVELKAMMVSSSDDVRR